MIKIGLTGSIASGKTTASKLISKKRGQLFSADKIVKDLYKKKSFKKLVAKKLALPFKTDFKKKLLLQIMQKENTLNKLEKIIHPLVRKEMFLFFKRYKNAKILFFEIPLLVESKLMKHFDTVIFIKAKKYIRLARYKKKYGDQKLFFRLDRHQIKDSKKANLCDYIVVNNGTLKVLKKKLLNIIKSYD